MRPHHERPRRIHAQRKRHQGRVGKIHHLRHDSGGNETQLPLLTAQGDDGPGGYGTGFTLTARPNTSM
jgi:hypothetical protein